MKNINTSDYWSYFIDFISPEFDSGVHDLVIKPNKFVSFENGTFTLLAPTETIKKLINNQFKNKLEVFMHSDSGYKVEIKAVLKQEINQINENIHENNFYNNSQPLIAENKIENGFNQLVTEYKNIYKPEPKYTFDNFIVGDSNKMAHKAASLFLNNPNSSLLFLHGGSGLGKTHLLSAIANQAIQESWKVVFMPANEFVEQYMSSFGHISASRGSAGSIDEFVKILNSVDLLVVDDIQGFNNKTGSADTFFNIFNYLVRNNKKIVLAADQPPNMLNGIPERLITRFNQGLTVKVLKPSVELAYHFLKRSLLEAFIESDEKKVADEVIEFLAENFSNDFRSLEGIVRKLSFTATIEPTDFVDMNYAKKHLLGDPITKEKIQGGKIQKIVAEAYNLMDETELVGKKRKKNIVEARHLSIWLYRRYLDFSYQAIGNIFGGRDHSTIMHSEKIVNKKIEEDKNFKSFVNGITKKIGL